MIKLINRLRRLQQAIREEGLGATTLALPAPKILLLEDQSAVDSKAELLFGEMITEKEIASVCRDLFEGGFYNQAVVEAFKALDHFIRKKANLSKLSGTNLMNNAFSPSSPKLSWSLRETTSQEDEQKGYHALFQGSFTGIRNPCSHEIDWISERGDALDAILLAQHLLRKARRAASEDEKS